MDTTDWLFVAGGVLATAAIEWWFFLAGRRAEVGR
jgi:hypothetical protein